MGGFANAIWLWLPLLIYKAVSALFRTIWKLNLWILQTICGVPIYYCKPEYRIPGVLFGTAGMMLSFNFVIFFLILSSEAGNNMSHQGISMSEIIIMAGFGIGFLVLCRMLIRRGSI